MKKFKIDRDNLNAFCVKKFCEAKLQCTIEGFPLPFEIQLKNKTGEFKADKWYPVWKFSTSEETPRTGFFNIVTAEVILPNPEDIKSEKSIKASFEHQSTLYAIRRQKGFIIFA